MDDSLKLQIDDYLTDNLSLEERKIFETKMQGDKELKKEVDLVKKLNIFLSNNAISESFEESELSNKLKKEIEKEESIKLKETILKINKEYKKDTIKKNNKSFFLIAASFALIAIGSLTFFFNNNSSQNLFAQYYSSNDLPAIIKRGDQKNALEKGVIQFDDKAYQQAKELFNIYIQENRTSVNPSVYIYLGVTNWELGKYKEATNSFDKMINSDSLDKSKALWFKALMYLNIDDKEHAIGTLNELINDPSNFKYSEAKEILSKIK
jgi:tetratricopeptide (TPR) repeat protein